MTKGTDLSNINVGMSIVLFFIFMFLLHANIMKDIEYARKLDKIVCHKEVDIPKIRGVDKLVIESVIEEYWKKRSMNKSKCSRIWRDLKTGFIRGALSGFITGGGVSGAASGAVVFGMLSGLTQAYHSTYSKPSYLNSNKHT